MQVTVPVLFCLIMCVGIVGNAAVIVVIVGRQKMSSTLNQLLLNLAASDSLFLILSIPFVTYHYSADNWSIGEPMCLLHQYVLYVSVYVTVYTLVSIAIARFLSIVYSDFASQLLTRLNVSVYLVVLWMVVCLGNVPVLIVYRVKVTQFGNEEPYYYCGMENDNYGQRLFTTFSILAYVMPLSITGALYLIIAHRLHRQMSSSSHGEESSTTTQQTRRIRAVPQSLPLIKPITCESSGHQPNKNESHLQHQLQHHHHHQQTVVTVKDVTEVTTSGDGKSTRSLLAKSWRSRAQKRNQHAIRLLVTVVVIFAMCWLPMHVHLLLTYFLGYTTNSRAYELFRVFCHCLAYSNCCMNPIIYNYTSPDFRRCFRELFHLDDISCCRQRFESNKASTFERNSTIGREHTWTWPSCLALCSYDRQSKIL